MRLFKVTADGYGYGDYISIVVVANSSRRAMEIAKQGLPYDWRNPAEEKVYWEFNSEQFPLHIEEVSLNQEMVIVSEYYGD